LLHIIVGVQFAESAVCLLLSCVASLFSSSMDHAKQNKDPEEEEDGEPRKEQDVHTGRRSVMQEWSTWQLIDSILPTGGFAHSYGLEAATQAGLVYDASTVSTFAVTTLENAGALLLPFVCSASKQTTTTEDWILLDSELHAVLTNHVARAASLSQGKALIRLASSVFPEITDEVKSMRACIQEKNNKKKKTTAAARGAHGHHAIVFGRLFGLLGLDSLTAQRAFLFLSLRDVLSAATRLNLVGPMEAALLQHRHASLAEAVLVKYANRGVEDAYQTAPLLDTLQGAHNLLFSRLFCS
jgi:urease accessory protein